MAINFPDTPSIGDEFTGGGFTWTWSGTSWEKVVQATGSASSAKWLRLSPAAYKRIPMVAGTHKLVAYSTALTASPTGLTWKAIGSNQSTVLSSGTFLDNDSGNTANGLVALITLSEDGYIEFTNPTAGQTADIEIFESLQAVETVLSPSVTTYTTSQSFAAPATLSSILIIGGGGGGGTGSTNQRGGAGGGSGYVNLISSGWTAGQTLTLTVGAGGTPGATGGTTSILGQNAAGGLGGGTGTNGANGGSGGGGGSNVNTWGGGGAGGTNGGNGNGGSGTSGGIGSGTTLPLWLTPGAAAGAIGNGYAGGGGGFYAGGTGGGGYDSSSPPAGGEGGNATGMGGGGGGGMGAGGFASRTGGSGADGGAMLLVGWA